ncbi:MAG: amidohydrolase family protein [Maricaulaceae bacterium]
MRTITKVLTTGLLSSFFCVGHAAFAASSSAGGEPGEEIISQFTSMGIAPIDAPLSGSEAEGPFTKLIIKNVNLIDGTGAPVQGGVNITIANSRIIAIDHVGGTRSGTDGAVKIAPGTRVIDASGQYVMPGLIDAHSHLGNPLHIYGGQLTDPEYVFKLYLAHGVTTVRDVGSLMGLNWAVRQKTASAAGNISAPRIKAYALFPENLATARASKDWVKAVKRKGADGVKFLGGSPTAVKAALEEIQLQGMGSAYHHSQVFVTRQNALDTSAWGLDSLEHWYGLPEAMFSDRRVQDYPLDYDYNNEQDRFREAGKLWQQTAKPGSDTWNQTIDQLIANDLTLSPTFSIYEVARDLMRVKEAEWHDDYTMPYMTRMFTANPKVHGSFFFNWRSEDEVAWRENYRLWMTFVNDFKNAGGRVVAGSDSGFMYSTYGFGYVRELELLQEAGFHPLEVIQSATMNGAGLLGLGSQTGTIEIGKRADLVIVNENPLANFKVLYGTGHEKYDFETGTLNRTKGIVYTIKDGIVYDSEKLRAQVRDLVDGQIAKEGLKTE